MTKLLLEGLLMDGDNIKIWIRYVQGNMIELYWGLYIDRWV